MKRVSLFQRGAHLASHTASQLRSHLALGALVTVWTLMANPPTASAYFYKPLFTCEAQLEDGTWSIFGNQFTVRIHQRPPVQYTAPWVIDIEYTVHKPSLPVIIPNSKGKTSSTVLSKAPQRKTNIAEGEHIQVYSIESAGPIFPNGGTVFGSQDFRLFFTMSGGILLEPDPQNPARSVGKLHFIQQKGIMEPGVCDENFVGQPCDYVVFRLDCERDPYFPQGLDLSEAFIYAARAEVEEHYMQVIKPNGKFLIQGVGVRPASAENDTDWFEYGDLRAIGMNVYVSDHPDIHDFITHVNDQKPGTITFDSVTGRYFYQMTLEGQTRNVPIFFEIVNVIGPIP